MKESAELLAVVVEVLLDQVRFQQGYPDTVKTLSKYLHNLNKHIGIVENKKEHNESL